jgi:hypothetical protein
MYERASCTPGTRVEVIETPAPAAARSGVVLYVGSDENVLVGWDDQSTSVLPSELLLPTVADAAPAAPETA